MKVLIACEESQTECIAFRNLGIEAYSCDIQPCSGGHPEWHIKDDVRNYLDRDWDLIIAHPPCTYLCKVSAVALSKNPKRYELLSDARDFFNIFMSLPHKHICVENPIPLKVANLPHWTQLIHPYMFGEPYSKEICLWLKGLPDLVPNVFFNNIHRSYHDTVSGSKKRSKSFQSIANAMAVQWSDYILNIK